MTIYTDLQSLAASLLTEFKQGTVYLIKLTAGSGSEDNPGAATETSYLLNATVKGVSKKYVDMAFAITSDLEVTASIISGVTPTATDFIQIDSVRYKIIEDISVPAAGTAVAWKFIVRKGG